MKGERRVRLKAGQRDQHKTDANVKGRERAGKRTDGHGARPPATAREGRTRGASPTGAQRGGSRHQPQPRERPRMGSRSPREPDEAPRRPTVPPDPGDGRATPPGVFKPTRRNATIQVPGQGRGGQDTRDAGTGQNGAPPPPTTPTARHTLRGSRSVGGGAGERDPTTLPDGTTFRPLGGRRASRSGKRDARGSRGRLRGTRAGRGERGRPIACPPAARPRRGDRHGSNGRDQTNTRPPRTEKASQPRGPAPPDARNTPANPGRASRREKRRGGSVRTEAALR